MKYPFLWLLIPLFFFSCNKTFLTVQTDYLTHKDLASYYVDTPDPRQNFTTIGQRLIICWSVPKYYLNYENLHLEVTIRFRNREEVVEIFHLLKNRGTYVFALLNTDYTAKKGILTYKVDLIGGDCILEEWRHQIWSDLILLNDQGPDNVMEQGTDNVMEEVKQEQREYEDEYPIDWHNDPL